MSHGVLDAMTTGGEGVAFFAPFDNSRYFLPWREIKVSPIGAAKFLATGGYKLLKVRRYGLACRVFTTRNEPRSTR